MTAINLSAFLALKRRVLLVDLDPQGHATLGLTPTATQYSRSMAELFVPKMDRRQVRLSDIIQTVSPNLDLAPTDILLSGAPERLAGVADRENILADAFDSVRGRYDYVLVDCPPSVGILTFNAVRACSEAVVPMDPSFFSLHGIGKALETFELLDRETGHHVDARVLVTLYPGRSPFVKAVLEDVQNHLPGRSYQTFIRYSVKLAEAASHGVPITQYSRHCAGFDDYRSLATEVLQMERSDSSILQESQTTAVPPVSLEIPADRNWPWIESPRVSVTSDGVVFTVEALAAERVQLVGDFNGWSTEGSDMQRDGALWRKVLNLSPGRYLYRFVVDGNWESDPIQAAVEGGGRNSVLVVEEQPGETPVN